MIPLPHTVTLVEPHVTVNALGDTVRTFGPEATRTTIAAWIQNRGSGSLGTAQDQALEGRIASVSSWRMYTIDCPFDHHYRVEWQMEPGGQTHQFYVNGIPAPKYTTNPSTPHHYETNLKLTEG